MRRNPRFDIFFEPVQIGPVTSKNRFYQVPHCTGMGYNMPKTLAGMREVKAEGGWGVVCTEYCSIHPTSDDTPYPHATLWDNEDVKAHRPLWWIRSITTAPWRACSCGTAVVIYPIF